MIKHNVKLSSFFLGFMIFIFHLLRSGRRVTCQSDYRHPSKICFYRALSGQQSVSRPECPGREFAPENCSQIFYLPEIASRILKQTNYKLHHQSFNRVLVFRFQTHTLFDFTEEETKTWSICQAASKQVWSIIKYLNLIGADKLCRCWNECSEDIILFCFNLFRAEDTAPHISWENTKAVTPVLHPTIFCHPVANMRKSQRLLAA